MKVLIVSDTHGRDENLEKVMEYEKPVDFFIHCGDIEGREDYIEALAECPVCLVSGNNDFFSELPREEEITLCGKRVLVTHGHYYGVSLDLGRILEEARDRDMEIVMFGHTHKPLVYGKRGTTLINPGSLSYPRQAGRKPSYMVLNTDKAGNFSFEIRYLNKNKKTVDN